MKEQTNNTNLDSKAKGNEVYTCTDEVCEVYPPWFTYYDEDYKCNYYYNTVTKESSWEVPQQQAQQNPQQEQILQETQIDVEVNNVSLLIMLIILIILIPLLQLILRRTLLLVLILKM